MSRFSDTLLEHARHPVNLGRDVEANAVGLADIGGQPPVMEIYLTIANEKVEKAAFFASGCGVTIAVGSALTELIKGLSVKECKAIETASVAQVLGGIPNDKLYCAEVGIAAMRLALSKPTS